MVSRLSALLELHCAGDFLFFIESIDKVYIKLRKTIEEILHTEGFENILISFPQEIPTSLHSLGQEADEIWEIAIQPTLMLFKGQVLEFCVENDASYGNDRDYFVKTFLIPFDEAIESFRKHKKKRESELFSQLFARLNESPKATQSQAEGTDYVDPQRLKELSSATSPNFDLIILVELCKELNKCYSIGSYLAVSMLVRTLIDHVPPIFCFKTFAEVTSNYNGAGKSFRESMQRLQESSRKIADAHLHTPIRKKEMLPTKTQVNFSNDIDVLFAEIVRILK